MGFALLGKLIQLPLIPVPAKLIDGGGCHGLAFVPGQAQG
jgi:hypothetical protein